MDNDSLVSVIIPTYKRAKYIIRAIESVLNQTYKNIEIIVVDDNGIGTEFQLETENMLNEFIKNNKINYIKHELNKNGSAARNTGIKNAKGKYIAFLDDDDEFLTDKIEKQVNRLENLDYEWGACYTSFYRVKNNKYIKYINKKEGDLFNDIVNMKIDLDPGSSLLIRKEVIDEIGGFDESFKRHQDIEFLARIAYQFKIAGVFDICVNKYEYGTNSPKTAEQMEMYRNHYIEKFLPYFNSEELKNEFIFNHKIDLAKKYLQEKNLKKTFLKLKESKRFFYGLVSLIIPSIKFVIRKIRNV